jgi:hypothetical protein
MRELRGEDELEVLEGPTGATTLLARLLHDEHGEAQPELAWQVSLSDRDRLLAALYDRLFGSELELIARCGACARNFESRLSLHALLGEQLARDPEPIPEPDGSYLSADGLRFRLPTARDERALVAADPVHAARLLLERCRLDAHADLERVDAVLASHAPVLHLTLAAACAECGARADLPFCLASFLMQRLAHERRLLLREVHCLARAYGWGLREILGLTRGHRRELVALILAERGHGGLA